MGSGGGGTVPVAGPTQAVRGGVPSSPLQCGVLRACRVLRAPPGSPPTPASPRASPLPLLLHHTPGSYPQHSLQAHAAS